MKIFETLYQVDYTQNKLGAGEQLEFIAEIPAGEYEFYLENHDILAGPVLSCLLEIASPQKTLFSEHVHIEFNCK